MIGIDALGNTLLAVVPTASRSGSSFSQIWPWLLVLLGVLFAGAILIAVIRRSLRSGDAGWSEGFTLSDLRKLQAEGRLTQEELQRAEQAMIQRVRAQAEQEKAPKSKDAPIPSQGQTRTGADGDSAREDAE